MGKDEKSHNSNIFSVHCCPGPSGIPSVCTLSRRKQGFESPRERQLNQVVRRIGCDCRSFFSYFLQSAWTRSPVRREDFRSLG
jgi:hypothetical protein